MVDKYVYPGTRVLINKLHIEDGKKLDAAEYSFVSLNINNLIRNPITINSLKDINENKYKTIKEYEVEKYDYQAHNIKK